MTRLLPDQMSLIVKPAKTAASAAGVLRAAGRARVRHVLATPAHEESAPFFDGLTGSDRKGSIRPVSASSDRLRCRLA